jgi:hypothetical protein
LGWVSVISDIVAVVWVLAVVSEAAEVENVWVWLETVEIGCIWTEIDMVVVVCGSIWVPASLVLALWDSLAFTFFIMSSKASFATV